jgi:hypothetical protein
VSQPDYEVTSPHGPLRVASWRCEPCAWGSGMVYRDPDDDGSNVRAAAVDHARRNGCTQVQVFKGTLETITALSTRVPGDVRDEVSLICPGGREITSSEWAGGAPVFTHEDGTRCEHGPAPAPEAP